MVDSAYSVTGTSWSQKTVNKSIVMEQSTAEGACIVYNIKQQANCPILSQKTVNSPRLKGHVLYTTSNIKQTVPFCHRKQWTVHGWRGMYCIQHQPSSKPSHSVTENSEQSTAEGACIVYNIKHQPNCPILKIFTIWVGLCETQTYDLESLGSFPPLNDHLALGCGMPTNGISVAVDVPALRMILSPIVVYQRWLTNGGKRQME